VPLADDLERVYVDPERRYVIQRPADSDPALRLWTVQRLQFHTSQPPWQKQLVNRFVDEMRALLKMDPEVLRGVFISDDRALVDAENVLFYNLHARSFVGAPECLRFERVRLSPPPAPGILESAGRYHHVYEAVRLADGFSSWQMTADDLVRWVDVPCPGIGGERAGWSMWRGMSRASGSHDLGAPHAHSGEDFGLIATLRVPAGVRCTAVSAVKAVVDGAIASFQRFPAESERAREVASLLAPALGEAEQEVLGWLTEDRARLFLEPPFNRRGRVALNPCDDRCVVGELTVIADPSIATPLMSGRIAAVVPITLDAPA
jgi:hypothetical protein